MGRQRMFSDSLNSDNPVYAMWEIGMSDVDIANHLYCDKKTVRNWRVRNGLHDNVRYYNSMRCAEIMKLYKRRLSDEAIAETVGSTVDYIRQWRYNRKLPILHKRRK